MLHKQIEARRNQIKRASDMTVKDQTVSGRTLITGIGEVDVPITFPYVFSGKPVFTYGADLVATAAEREVGFPPHLAATATVWDTFGVILGAFDGYHIGCTLTVETKGSEGQQMWLTWSFKGPALRNPVQSDDVIFL